MFCGSLEALGFFYHILQIINYHAYAQVGNIGGREFAESLAPDVQKLLVSDSCSIELVLQSLKVMLTIFFFLPFVLQDIK